MSLKRGMSVRGKILHALEAYLAAGNPELSEREQALTLFDAAIAGEALLRDLVRSSLTAEERTIAVDARYCLIRLRLAAEATWLAGRVLTEAEDERLSDDVGGQLADVIARAKALPDRRPGSTIPRRTGW